MKNLLYQKQHKAEEWFSHLWLLITCMAYIKCGHRHQGWSDLCAIQHSCIYIKKAAENTSQANECDTHSTASVTQTITIAPVGPYSLETCPVFVCWPCDNNNNNNKRLIPSNHCMQILEVLSKQRRKTHMILSLFNAGWRDLQQCRSSDCSRLQTFYSSQTLMHTNLLFFSARSSLWSQLISSEPGVWESSCYAHSNTIGKSLFFLFIFLTDSSLTQQLTSRSKKRSNMNNMLKNYYYLL